APVHRRSRGSRIVRPEARADDGNAVVMQRHDRLRRELDVDGTGELHIGCVELGQRAGQHSREHHGEVSLDVQVVWREHDRSLWTCRGEASPELGESVVCLLRTGNRRLREYPVRGDGGEDETHSNELMRSMSSSRKPSASTRTPTCAFGSRPVLFHKSTTVRPRQSSDSVSISTLRFSVPTRSRSSTCATVRASWIGEPSKS